MKEFMLQNVSQSREGKNSAFSPLLRTILHPLPQCPLFKLMMETEHRWPSHNLLNGSASHRSHFLNGAHLVISGNRLLVVRGSEHFYCPSWDSVVHDAHIQKQGLTGHLLLVVGLTNGVYAALLQDKPRLQIVDDFFLATRKPVKKIFYLENGEAAICYGNAHVETYRVTVKDYQTVELLPREKHRASKIFETVTSMWDTRRFIDGVYDAMNKRLFVLSNCDLTLWAHRTGGDMFAPLCSVGLQNSAVAVLPGFQAHQCAMLIFANGGRQPVCLHELEKSQTKKTAHAVMSLGSVRSFPPDIQLESVQLACQDYEGTLVLYESHTNVLVVVTVAFPIYEGIYDMVEVVSTFQLKSAVVGISCVSGVEDDSRARFVVYGKSGILCHICLQSTGQMVANLVKTPDPSCMVPYSLRNLGPRRAMEAVLGAIFIGASTETFLPLLNELMKPSFRGNTMHVSPGVHGIVSIVRHELVFAQRFWGASFSWHLSCDLKRVSATLQKWNKTLETLLRPHGWLDSPRRVNLSWHAFVATSHECFTMRTALNAQALVLETLLRGLNNAGMLCCLYSLLLHGTSERTAVSRIELERIVWGGDTDAQIAALCMEVLSNADSVVLGQLDMRKNELPPRARHAISIQTFIAKNQPDAAMTYACANIKSLRHEGVLLYAAEKLEIAFPDYMPHLRLLLCWSKQNYDSVDDLLLMLHQCTKNEPPERVKQRLGVVMQAAAGDPVLYDAVMHWLMGRPLDDGYVVKFAEVLEEHSVVIKEPDTLTALFFVCWINRRRDSAAAARGFGDIARSKQRLALSFRILCVKLALECAPTTSEQLVYFVLLLQEELVDVIEAWLGTDVAATDLLQQQNAKLDVDELCHFYVEERRLFDLAAQYKKDGGAKIQFDLLKVHPETPQKVTVGVLHSLLEFLLSEGMSPTEAVQNVVREYYGGYAAGLPLLPFVEFLAQHGEDSEKIATILHSGGVPPHAVFDIFLHFLDDRREGIAFSRGSVAITLVSLVAQMSGERKGVCARYLLGRINSFLAAKHETTELTTDMLREDDFGQLQHAEALLQQSFSVSPV